jgi:uncharacterized protein (DUF433 family)
MRHKSKIIPHPSMVKRRLTIVRDIREAPMYAIGSAAFYLNIASTTLDQWFYGRKYRTRDGRTGWSDPLIEPADKKRGLLSFANMAEAHVLQATRDKRIPMLNVREALTWARRQWPTVPHPLITRDFHTHGKYLFVKTLSEIINASKGGQVEMGDFLDPYLERLVRDESGLPFRLFPMRNNPSSNVMLDLHIASGQPVITDTGILAQVLYERNGAGETEDELARDYGLDKRTVEDAIRYIEAAAA